MNDPVGRHIHRLRTLVLAFVVGFAVYAGVIAAVPDPTVAAVPQAGTLFWGLAFMAVANLATVMPSYRAMMVAPRRVFAVGRQPELLLAAHLRAYLVALARVQAVAVLGLLLFFVAGRRDWFWVFWAVAGFVTALLWPSRSKVAGLVVPRGKTSDVPTL